jgi:predicted transcriptional regulator
MASTTIRLDVTTRDRLRAIAERRRTSLTETLEAAVRELERKELALQVKADYARLRADPEAWADYVAELDAYPAGDGLP